MSAKRKTKRRDTRQVPTNDTRPGVDPRLSEPRLLNPTEREGEGSGPDNECANTPHNVGALRDFRRRMGCVGQLVRDMCGLDGDTDPHLVVRDAYLVVVSEIIHAISSAEDRLPTDELIQLSKAIAEHRRLDISQAEIEGKTATREQKRKAAATDHDADADESTKSMDEMVNDVYGTNMSGKDGASEKDDA